MSSRPTDPIRDPELLHVELDGLERLAETDLGGDPKRALLASVARLRAALQEDPPVRRYSLEEIRERLLGGEVVRAAAAYVYEGEGKGGPPYFEDCPCPEVHLTETRSTLEAALATAFDGATPTRKDRHEELRKARAQGEQEAEERLYAFFNDDEFPEAQLRFKLAYADRQRQRIEDGVRGLLAEARKGIDADAEVLEDLLAGATPTQPRLVEAEDVLHKIAEGESEPWRRRNIEAVNLAQEYFEKRVFQQTKGKP